MCAAHWQTPEPHLCSLQIDDQAAARHFLAQGRGSMRKLQRSHVRGVEAEDGGSRILKRAGEVPACRAERGNDRVRAHIRHHITPQ